MPVKKGFGKEIGIPGFTVELIDTSKPGLVRAGYILPENDKQFDLGELEMKMVLFHFQPMEMLGIP